MSTNDPVRRLTLAAPSPAALDRLRADAEAAGDGAHVILDLTGAAIDDALAPAVLAVVAAIERRGGRVALLGLDGPGARRLLDRDPTAHVADCFAVHEADALHVLDLQKGTRPKDRLVRGIQLFRRDLLPRYEPLFLRLAHSQKPHTLFITCSDSRIDPSLVTSTDPGELFLVRNVGNLVPPAGNDDTPAEGAAVEYALSVLEVDELVVCGHAGCGAMKALHARDESPLAHLTSLTQWLAGARALVDRLPEGATANDLGRANVLAQLENLYTYPIVRHKVVAGEVRLHAWFYDIQAGRLDEWDPAARQWRSLGE